MRLKRFFILTTIIVLGIFVVRTKSFETYQRNVLQPSHGTLIMDSPRDDKLNAKLNETIEELEFNDITIGEALETIRIKKHVNVMLDEEVLKRAGVSLEQKIHMHLYDVHVYQAINVLLESWGNGNPKLGFEIRNGVIFISTQDSLNRANVSTFAYDIEDLRDRLFWPKTLNPLSGEGPEFKNLGSFSTSATIPSSQENIDFLLRIIQESIDANSWRDNGGIPGVLYEFGGVLFVTQTPANRDRVARLLKNLRKMRDEHDRGVPVKNKGTDLFE